MKEGAGRESRRHSLAKSDPGDHARPLRLRAAAYFAGTKYPFCRLSLNGAKCGSAFEGTGAYE
jgi:hypothetical protein